MSTRGAYGFRIHQNDKITYNHCDSYPSSLGIVVISFIKSTPISELKTIAENIILIKNRSKPTKKQIGQCKKWADLSVSEKSLNDWYCLLHKTQGDLNVYKDGLTYMIDSNEFLFDSLFCEWAYIINIDTNTLEVYKGVNESKTALGRYASNTLDKENVYYGVALINEIPLPNIKKMSNKTIFELCKRLENSESE